MADLKALVKRMNDEVFSQGKVDVVDELLTEDFVEHEELPGLPPGREGVKQFTLAMRTAFPDLKAETVAVGVDGDDVWVQTIFSGTHKGDFMGIPATGKKVSVQGIDRIRTRDGKASEHWGVTDMMAMMTQLGVMEPPH
jgi:steroid delta-isomerase-like uncharacterized protein